MIRAALRLCSNGSAGSTGRGLSTSQTIFSRKARRMLLQEDAKGRKKSFMNFEFPTLDEPAQDVVKPRKTKFKVPKSNRHRNLNKVYLDKITDILSTGELSAQLYGRGVELSQVCIHPDMDGISVYWVTTGNPEQDLQTQKILQSNAKKIQYELSSLRIISQSPPLTFLRDDRLHKLKEVERLLNIADYGEDFEPANPAHHLMAAPPTLTLALDDNVKSAIKGLERTNEQEQQPDPFEVALRIASEPPEDAEEPTIALPNDLPTMKSDVFGVNTEKIYTMIQQSMKKARADHRKLNETNSLNSLLGYSGQDVSDPVNVNRKRDIQQWANKYRKIQRNEKRIQNRENYLLSYPRDHISEDFGEQEMEVLWEEELEYDEKFE